MTSLQEAFGESADTWRREERESPQPSASHYTDPVHPRYQDVGVEDAEKRYAYEQSRQQLYAKSPPQTSSAHPVLSSQESFQQLLPGGQQLGGASVLDAAMSCSSCHGVMSCGGQDEVFCRQCNHDCLQPKHAGGQGIPHLWQ